MPEGKVNQRTLGKPYEKVTPEESLAKAVDKEYLRAKLKVAGLEPGPA